MRIKSLSVILLSAIILGGCISSETATQFQEAREGFGNRIGVENEQKATEGQEKSDGPVLVREWYAWQIEPTVQELQTADEIALVQAKVLNVVDGDTIDVKITNGEEERVRFILIDTPESTGKHKDNPEPFALDAKAFTEEQLLNRTVFLQIGVEERDQYGRLLAYVWLDNVYHNRDFELDGETYVEGKKLGMLTINELLLREGLAQVAVYPPNTEYVDHFETVQKGAKSGGKGLWNQ